MRGESSICEGLRLCWREAVRKKKWCEYCEVRASEFDCIARVGACIMAEETKSVSVYGSMHTTNCSKKKRRSNPTNASPVKLEPQPRTSETSQRRRLSFDTDPATLQAELAQTRAKLAQTQAERDAAVAEIRKHRTHDAKTELQASLWRTTEQIKAARKERDDLESAHRELLTLHADREAALTDLEVQKTHQQEQIREIETDLQSSLSRTLSEIDLVRAQRDALIAEKNSQLERQCDAAFEVEMALKVELRRVQSELALAHREREAAVLAIHLQQEHEREQVRAIEAELQALIQVKAEELKAVQRERDRAVCEACSQLEVQCDQVTEVEVRLQRNLKGLLGEIQSAQAVSGAREVRETLLASRNKLRCLQRQRAEKKAKKRNLRMVSSTLQTQKKALKKHSKMSSGFEK